MTTAPNILLLAEPADAAIIAQRLARPLAAHADPYDLLQALARHPSAAVLLTAPRPDLPSLCRAIRRISPAARLLVFCAPAAEPQVRPLAADLLDDYFIYPPTRDELNAIRNLAAAPPASTTPVPMPAPAPTPPQTAPAASNWVNDRPQAPGRADAGCHAPAAVSRSMLASDRQPLAAPLPPAPAAADLEDFAALVTAAIGNAGLESAVVELLGRRLGIETRWVDADELAPADQPLLLVSGQVPRVLVPAVAGLAVPAAAQQALSALQQVLPALADNARRIESLHRLAITDHLTGAYNRRYFYHLTEQILLRASQKRFRVTLLLYDIDNFKHYNETYGHAAGDEILRETARLMKQTCRSHDVVARIGGDEFAALFWDAQPPRSPDSKPLESIVELANRFRTAVSTHSFASLGPEALGSLTISGGLAGYPEGGATCRELLRSADRALRQAKGHGKNTIHLIGPET